MLFIPLHPYHDLQGHYVLKYFPLRCVLIAGGVAVLKAPPKSTGMRPKAVSNSKPHKETTSPVVKRLPEVKYDELEQIAAIIAGAGIHNEDEIRNLEDAVKDNGHAKKKKGKKQAEHI